MELWIRIDYSGLADMRVGNILLLPKGKTLRFFTRQYLQIEIVF